MGTPIRRLHFIGRSGALTHHPVGVGQRLPSMVNDGVDAPSTSDGVDFSYLAFSHHRSGSTLLHSFGLGRALEATWPVPRRAVGPSEVGRAVRVR